MTQKRRTHISVIRAKRRIPRNNPPYGKISAARCQQNVPTALTSGNRGDCFSRLSGRASRGESHIPRKICTVGKALMGNPSKVGGALVVQRVCTAEEVGKRPSGSRLLSFFPLCRPVSLSLPSRRSLKKDFARREGGGGATGARNSGISRVPTAGEEGWRR